MTQYHRTQPDLNQPPTNPTNPTPNQPPNPTQPTHPPTNPPTSVSPQNPIPWCLDLPQLRLPVSWRRSVSASQPPALRCRATVVPWRGHCSLMFHGSDKHRGEQGENTDMRCLEWSVVAHRSLEWRLWKLLTDAVQRDLQKALIFSFLQAFRPSHPQLAHEKGILH